MDGESLSYKLGQLLQEISSSTFLDARTSYDYLFEAVKEFQRRTNALTATQFITTVASQSTYDLNPDFMHLWFRNQWNELVLKYTQSSGAITWIKFRDYDVFAQESTTTPVPVPSFVTIIDKHSQSGRIAGSATSGGALTYGECTLTDVAAPFGNVTVADSVHNTSDGSAGIVIEKTSNSALITNLFGGTNNYWTIGNNYIVVPKGLKSIVFDPPPSAAGDTITVEYVQCPSPVYSYYRSYRIDPNYEMALVEYAAWMYKYRDREPNFGDAWFKQWDGACRKAISGTNKTMNRKSFRVNFSKQPFSYRDRSHR